MSYLKALVQSETQIPFSIIKKMSKRKGMDAKQENDGDDIYEVLLKSSKPN